MGKSNIVSKIQGGLGNQMFQYAMGRQLSINTNKTFYLDISYFKKKYADRRFLLETLNISGKRLDNKLISKMIFLASNILTVIAPPFYIVKVFKDYRFFKQESHFDNYWISYYDGYWQSYKYFENIRSQLLGEFTLKEISSSYNKCLQKISTNSVSIHIRRSDYITDSRYGFLGLEYYKKAIEFINSQIADPIFYIFTDDPEWCKNKFQQNDNFVFLSGLNLQDVEELILMSKCANQIIANSTFSWWAAWLNTNDKKIVIRPRFPFNDMSLLYCDHYPEQWIAI